MYEDMELRRKLLSTGLFRVAYGVDLAFADGDTVREIFVQSSVALERYGWSAEEILRDRDPVSCDVADRIMDDIDKCADDWCEHPDLYLLLFGLHELLRLQFREEDGLARAKFLEDLAALGGAPRAGALNPRPN
jgi:hypothetical protein